MSKVGTNDSKNTLYCSFCGKSQHEVRKLIAGPTVFICDECIELCMDIIREENKSSLVKSRDGTSARTTPRRCSPSPSTIITNGSTTRKDHFGARSIELDRLRCQGDCAGGPRNRRNFPRSGT